MQLETILSAAVNSMVRGHHAPHCFSAWVQGQGYVNKGDMPALRADYLAQLERAARSEVENMGYAASYAEPGYEQPKRGILLANWNRLPSKLTDVLERAGYSIEWSDEWSVCDCGKAFRTEPDSHSWTPAYTERDGELLCRECAPDDTDDDGDE